MALVTVDTYEVVKNRRYDYDKGEWLEPSIDRSFMKDEHTYFIVFGPYQGSEEARFVEAFKDEIIFKSKKACNKNYRTGPRNTLYIFEKKLDNA